MKKLLSLVFLLSVVTLSFTQAQTNAITLNSVTEKYFVENVVVLATPIFSDTSIVYDASMTEESLLNKTKEWIQSKYSDGKDSILFTDNHRVIIKSNFKVPDGQVHHTLVLYFRNGRFKYTYTDFKYINRRTGIIAFENLKFKKHMSVEVSQATEKSITADINSLTQQLKMGVIVSIIAKK